MADIAAAFRDHREHLMRLASRMLRSPTDAEDAVGEAYARLAAADAGAIVDVRGWLVTVLRRICLDRLDSAAHRTTAPAGSDPEGMPPAPDPADRITLDDQVRQALGIVLARLTPAERTAYLLHDVFGFPFDAVADLVGRTPAACRQLASRARRSIRRPTSRTLPPSSVDPVADRFRNACAGGDLDALIALLDPAAEGLAVRGGSTLASLRGAETVARRVLRLFGPASGAALERLDLEDRPALLAVRHGLPLAVIRLDVRAGLISHLHAVVMPTS